MKQKGCADKEKRTRVKNIKRRWMQERKRGDNAKGNVRFVID
jgi:hypothetical protein